MKSKTNYASIYNCKLHQCRNCGAVMLESRRDFIKRIVTKNYDKVLDTYDYDGIAEDVLDEWEGFDEKI